MIEVKMPHTCTMVDFFDIITPWLKERNIKHRYFSDKNVITFEDEDEADLFMAEFGGKEGYYLNPTKEQFRKELEARKWRRG